MKSTEAMRVSADRPRAAIMNWGARLLLALPLSLSWTFANPSPVRAEETAVLPAKDLPPAEVTPPPPPPATTPAPAAAAQPPAMANRDGTGLQSHRRR